MCGPSAQEEQLQAQQASFTQTLQNDYAQTFAANQQILSTLNATLQPIVQAGPSQQGFSQQELSTLNTQAIESNARGAQQAEQAAGAQEDALGGGKSFLPSGVNAQINAGIQSAAESNLSNEELGVTEANYATGRQNFQNALAGEESVAAGEAPLGYASATTNANSQAFNEANTINQQSQQFTSDLLGGIGGIVGMAAGGFGNLDTTGSSTGGEQALNFLGGL